MHIGMLWLIDDPKLPLSESITIAARYYQKKHGRLPELCLVNPSDGTAEVRIENTNITVRAYKHVLKRHLWIGIEDQRLLQVEL